MTLKRIWEVAKELRESISKEEWERIGQEMREDSPAYWQERAEAAELRLKANDEVLRNTGNLYDQLQEDYLTAAHDAAQLRLALAQAKVRVAECVDLLDTALVALDPELVGWDFIKRVENILIAENETVQALMDYRVARMAEKAGDK